MRPQTSGQTGARSSARRSSAAARGSSGRRRDLVAHDERHRGHDHGGADERERRDLLRQHDPAEEDGDHRVHVRVRRDPGHGRVLEQPGVGGVRHDRADEDEVGEGPQRLGRQPAPVDVAELARDRPGHHHEESGDRHLVAGRDERIVRQVDPARGDRARGPRDRGDHHEEEPGEAHARRLLTGQQQQRHADEPDRDARERGPAGVLAEQRAQDDDPQGDRGDQQRRQAGRDVLFGHRHETVAAGREQRADDRRGDELAARDAQRPAAHAQHGEHQAAGHGEAQPGAQQRRDGPHHDADRQVGRAPDHVDRPQAGPHLPRGRGERRRGRGALAHHAKASHAGGRGNALGPRGDSDGQRTPCGRTEAQAARRARASVAAAAARTRSRSTTSAVGRNGSATAVPSRSESAATTPPSASARSTGCGRCAAAVELGEGGQRSAVVLAGEPDGEGVWSRSCEFERSAVAGCEVDIQGGRTEPLPQMNVRAGYDKLPLCST